MAAAEDFSAVGLELSGIASRAAREAGLDVREGDFFAADLPDQSFDVITLWDVVASLCDPHRTLSRCRELLAPDGHVILTVPMLDGPLSRLLGRFWPLLIPPVNLHYFTRKSVEQLAVSQGFSVETRKTEGKLVSLRFIVQKGFRSLGWRRPEVWASRSIPVFPIYVNTRDICAVVLRATGDSST